MEISGAAKLVDKLNNEIQQKFANLTTKIYPTILKMENFDKKFQLFKKTLNKKQQNEINNNGYTFVDEEQSNMLYLFKGTLLNKY